MAGAPRLRQRRLQSSWRHRARLGKHFRSRGAAVVVGTTGDCIFARSAVPHRSHQEECSARGVLPCLAQFDVTTLDLIQGDLDLIQGDLDRLFANYGLRRGVKALLDAGDLAISGAAVFAVMLPFLWRDVIKDRGEARRVAHELEAKLEKLALNLAWFESDSGLPREFLPRCLGTSDRQEAKSITKLPTPAA